ncbi:MAG: hypothetical protein J5804_01690, partial [Eggerthellaceae bacterium]|nr:hypothetical protein [Eggerthellaceae bacterium]
DAHFEEILQHGSDVETRLDDSCCTRDSLKADNRAYREGFARCGEQVTLIDSDYDSVIAGLLEE